jgi:anti-sigma B factor antagonist
MNFSVAKQGDTIVVGIEGHLVVGNRNELKQLVLNELDRGERRFRIDFGRTRYVDSSGLGVLVALSKRIGQERGTLSLSRLDPDMRTLFDLTKLDTLFSFDESGPDDVVERAATPRPRLPERRHGGDDTERGMVPPP